jgi:hypothetical protein
MRAPPVRSRLACSSRISAARAGGLNSCKSRSSSWACARAPARRALEPGRRGLACSIAARRLILALVVLLVISSAAAALIPIRHDADSSSTTPAQASTPAGKLIKRTLHAGADEPKTIRIHEGDELVLRVTSPAAGQVEVGGLGELAYVDPDTPASFDLLPFETGRYPVQYRLLDDDVDSRHAVGHIVVAGRRGDQGGASPIDSPGDSTTGLTAGALLAI